MRLEQANGTIRTNKECSLLCSGQPDCYFHLLPQRGGKDTCFYYRKGQQRRHHPQGRDALLSRKGDGAPRGEMLCCKAKETASFGVRCFVASYSDSAARARAADRLCLQLKKKLLSPGVEPATFWVAVQSITHWAMLDADRSLLF